MKNRTKGLRRKQHYSIFLFFFPIGQFLLLFFIPTRGVCSESQPKRRARVSQDSQSTFASSNVVKRKRLEEKAEARAVTYTHVTLGCRLHVLAPVVRSQGALLHSQQQPLGFVAGSQFLAEVNSSSDYSASSEEKPPLIPITPYWLQPSAMTIDRTNTRVFMSLAQQ